jgi:hypothetical protein
MLERDALEAKESDRVFERLPQDEPALEMPDS